MLTCTQIRTAIPKLERRLRELQDIAIEERSEEVKNALSALHKKIEGTLMDVFGVNTLEYQRFEVREFWLSVPMYTGGTPDREWFEGYRGAVAKAISTLQTAVEFLEEKLEDMGESPEAQALQAYQGLELHVEIDRAGGELYRNGHFANAIEDSVKALNALVRLRSGVDDLDGTKLMEHVFSPNSPVLKFNELKDKSEEAEQRGFMMLFSGAVVGLRNPRAHKLIQDDPEQALEFIAFISLLAKLLDSTRKHIA
jgi:uncharacterized protein (TIGR02391 family)